MKIKIKMKCKVCEKVFEYYISTHLNRKFCSNKCKSAYFKEYKIGAFFDPKIRALSRETQRKNKKGKNVNCKWCKKLFYVFPSRNKKFCSHKCKGKYWKKYKIGSFFDSKLQSAFGKKGGKIGGHNSQKTLKEKKLSCFYNLEQHRKVAIKGGKFMGPIMVKRLREKKGYFFKSIHFDSKSEMEIGMCIHYQLEKIKEEKNYQIRIDSLTFDFFVKKCFIEYHPFNGLYDTIKSYKNWEIKRRKVLNKNGYKNYPLIVIK